MNFISEIDQTWTLFLDRDGVINRRPPNDYVKCWEDFDFLPGVLESLKIFNKLFNRIIIVTNQQGIGKNLMSKADLALIHKKMIDKIVYNGGRIDKVFFCPDLTKKSDNCRKPGIMMAMKAKTLFPEIIFEKSIMAGDTESDLQFGKKAGMKTVFINSNKGNINNSLIDAEFTDLFSFANSLIAND